MGETHQYIPALWARRVAEEVFGRPSVLAALIKYRRRSWRERLFTRPWRPWVSYELVRPPRGSGRRVRVKLRGIDGGQAKAE